MGCGFTYIDVQEDCAGAEPNTLNELTVTFIIQNDQLVCMPHDSNFQWRPSVTEDKRYEKDGAIICMEEYVIRTGCQTLDVLDVGCSNGVASKYMQKYMQSKHNVTIETTGVEPNPRLWKQAEENLDHLYKDKIQNIVPVKLFDVVIFNKVAYFAFPAVQKAIVSHCVKFLRDEGALITDVNEYNTEIRRIGKCKLYLGRKNALNHSDAILASWQALPAWKKCLHTASKRFSLNLGPIVGHVQDLCRV